MIVTIAVFTPPELVAVTVYDVDDDITVGVPEISPVDTSMANPFGKLGDIAQEITTPPALVGVAVGDIGESLVKVKDEGE